MRRLSVPAKLLEDGDVIIVSRRYRSRLRGAVKIRAKTEAIVFLDEPRLVDEDVAFQANEMIEIKREEKS